MFTSAGEGLTATIIPGCPETFQSPQHGQHGGTFQDHHQQIRRFRAGDILVVPAGVAHWTYNDGDTPVIAVNFYDVSNDANQLDNNPRVRQNHQAPLSLLRWKVDLSIHATDSVKW